MSGTKTLDEHNKAVMASCVRLTGISGTGGHTSADLATFLEAYSAERAARLKAEADLDALIHEGTPDAVQHLTTRALRAEGRAARAERALEEREADMHNRIRAGYDATVADSWRARVAELEAELAAVRAQLATLSDSYESSHASRMHAEDALRRAEAELSAARAQLATLSEAVETAVVTEDGDPADLTRCEPLRRALKRLT